MNYQKDTYLHIYFVFYFYFVLCILVVIVVILDGWNDVVIDTQTPTKPQRKKEKRVQMIVDKLQRWNELVHVPRLSCYLASEFLKKKENDENEENKENKQDVETEMKNLMKNNMRIHLYNSAPGRSFSSEPLSSIVVSDSENNRNPFVSRQAVIVLAQSIMKDANNNTLNLGDIYGELDSLDACLNVIRFLLLKDKETNSTNIFDEMFRLAR